MFDVTAAVMFMPGAQGKGDIVKMTKKLRPFFKDGEQITEAHGEALYRWAHAQPVPGEDDATVRQPAAKPARYHLAGQPYAKLRDAIEAAGQIAWDRETAECEQDMILTMLGDINTLAGKYPDDEAVLAQRDTMNGIAGRVHDLTSEPAEAEAA